MILRVFFALLLFLLVKSEEVSEEPKIEQLPRCKHVNPYENLEEWLRYERKDCNYTTPSADEQTPEEKDRFQWGSRSFAFDALASERIGLQRDNGRQAHPLCADAKFDSGTLQASVIIIHHNEALSVILRMIHGIFKLTSPDQLKEIVVYEDASEEEHRISSRLAEAAEIMGWQQKMIIETGRQREGLIRAKVLASRLATGDVLVFLDSHCEVTEGWMPPLLQPIQEDRRSVVLPVVDLINPTSFVYSKAMVSKSGFDWSLTFQWIYLPWEYFEKDENNVKPIPSPSMSGGLLAIGREFFREVGEYDMGMLIWGAENVELSLKTWMCGGRVVVAPCSRVGHVFRMRRPYKSKPGLDTNLFNSLRVAKAWLGDYEDQFLRARPRAVGMDFGDVSYAAAIKDKLNCKDMKWYLENVYPELVPLSHTVPKNKDEL